MLRILNCAQSLLNQNTGSIFSELPSLPAQTASLADKLHVSEGGRKNFFTSQSIFFPFEMLQLLFFYLISDSSKG